MNNQLSRYFMVHKHQHMYIFKYSPNCHQQFSTSIWFIDHK